MLSKLVVAIQQTPYLGIFPSSGTCYSTIDVVESKSKLSVIMSKNYTTVIFDSLLSQVWFSSDLCSNAICSCLSKIFYNVYYVADVLKQWKESVFLS